MSCECRKGATCPECLEDTDLVLPRMLHGPLAEIPDGDIDDYGDHPDCPKGDT